MAVLLTPKTSRLVDSVIEDAKRLATKAIDIEISSRLGSAELYSPMKFFVFSRTGDIYPLWGHCFGKPQEHPILDGKAQLALVVKIMTAVLESRVVLHITEAWTAMQCHQCGKDYPANKAVAEPDWRCSCGSERCAPADNPHRIENLLANLVVFGGYDEKRQEVINDGYFWNYVIKRNDASVITEFVPDSVGVKVGLGGRMCDHWILQDYEVPHFVVNYPVFCDALGTECPENARLGANLARLTAPPNYPLLSWGLHTDIKEVLQKIKLQEILDSAPNN